jgi:TPR repeat protein
MCELLICKFIGSRGKFRGMFRANQLKHLAECVATTFHFIGTKNEAEYLFQEGKKILKQSAYSATEKCRAIKMFEKASLLMHPESNAVLSNMMFESSSPIYNKHSKLSFKYAALGARMGCRHSKGLLAKCYIYGKGVIKDVGKGLTLAKESAMTGSCYGQLALAMCYINGIGFAQDHAEAVHLLHLSAGQGYAIAQFELGKMYQFGISVAQDYAEAVRLYSLAAEQDHFLSEYQLRCMRRDGHGGA